MYEVHQIAERQTTTILALVGKRVPRHVAHLLNPTARLDALDMNPLDRYFSLPCDVEEQFGIEFEDALIEGWRTVQDIIDAVSTGEPK